MASLANAKRVALFDLDGTLLPVELDFFLRHYMDGLYESFQEIMTRRDFDAALLGATYETIENLDPDVTNLEAFARAFSRRTGIDWDSLWPMILSYYKDVYPGLRRYVTEELPAREVVSQCVADGWEIVLATQPLFPEVAVRERMRWCGIDSLPWLLITTLENMHFCKPHAEYYQEILEKLGVRPSQCAMIGNDIQEDMAASTLGIKTYLAEEFLLDRGTGGEHPDCRGPLSGVPSWLRRVAERRSSEKDPG